MNTILSERPRSFRTFIFLMFGAIGTVATTLARGPRRSWREQADCHVGTYRLRDGAFVDIAVDDGHLRWRREDGTSGLLTVGKDGRWTSALGWTGRPDGKRVSFSECGAGRIAFDGVPGQRVAMEVTETTFDGAGVRLAGRLVMPKGGDKVPIVENTGEKDLPARALLQRQLPAEGIGVFVTTSAARARQPASTRRTTCCSSTTPLRR
jgi:hypothetical protein